MLPENYQLGPNDVIIGRGKKVTQNPGNQRFRLIIQTTLESYSNAETKVKKSEIIMEVLSQVREGNGAGFVKHHAGSGCYLQVEEASCRIAIAQAFRDALSGTYKSSKKHKQIRRLERKRASETEQSMALASMQLQELFNHEPQQEPASLPTLETQAAALSLRNKPEARNAVPVFQLRGILQEASNVPPLAMNPEPLQFNLAPPTIARRPTLNLTDTEPLPLNVSFGSTMRAAPTLNFAANDLFSSLCRSLGVNQPSSFPDPFEPTPLSNQQASIPSYSHYAPRAA
ncbi:Nitrilase family, member 2 [Seminavis robusta]|uniref:Nitrilase family, member 2 n=1 Tax=Seminavis robusta TaxID=568900 RepID=A0A9N8DLQ3_9STRA|nr:Nitrilase family, member 2 [Seminavis robusta]|eukprot:Sro195_g083150.1 Nitrilase family, member 2 (286) ;mRNA; f:34865-35722